MTVTGQPPVSVLRRVARSSAWYVAGFALASGASFAVSIVVGRALGPADFGRFSYHVWVMRLLATILALGVPAAMTRFIAASLGAGDEGAVRAHTRLAARAALVLVPLAGAASGGVALWRDGSLALAWIVGLGAAITLTGVFLDGVLGGFRAFRTLASVAFWSGVAAVALVVAGALGDAGWRAFIALQVASTGVGVAILAVASARRVRGRPSGRHQPGAARAVLRFAGTMAVIGLLTEFVLGRPELFFLDRWWPAADVGLYSAALRLSTLVVILPGIAARVLVSEFSWTAGSGATAEFRAAFAEVCRYAALVGVGMGLVTAALSDHLIAALFGHAFAPAGAAGAVLLLGGTVAGVTSPVGAAILTGERHGVVARLTAVAAALNLLLDVTLIPRFGVMGAAVATMIALTASGTLVSVWAWRRDGLPYPVRALGRLLLAGAVGALAARAAAGGGPSTLQTLAALVAGGAVYLGAAFALRVVTPAELVAVARARGRS